jgi:hypothetical protein
VNREEYLARLATEPATANQRGAIMSEFERLGFHHRRDRAERLAVCAALLGTGELGSTAELTQGQAGQLVNLLQRITDRAELPRGAAAPAASDSQPDGQDHDEPGAASPPAGGRVTWLQVIAKCLATFYSIACSSTGGDLSDRQEPPG